MKGGVLRVRSRGGLGNRGAGRNIRNTAVGGKEGVGEGKGKGQ